MDNLNKSFPETFFNDVETAREEIKAFIEDRLRKLHAMMPVQYNLGISVRFNTEPKFVNETYINVINSNKKNLLGAIQHEKADVVYGQKNTLGIPSMKNPPAPPEKGE